MAGASGGPPVNAMYLCNPIFLNFHVSFYCYSQCLSYCYLRQWITCQMFGLATIWPPSLHASISSECHTDLCGSSDALQPSQIFEFCQGVGQAAFYQYITQQSIYSTHIKLVGLSNAIWDVHALVCRSMSADVWNKRKSGRRPTSARVRIM